MTTMRQRALSCCEDPDSSRCAGFLALFMAITIVLSTASVVFETEVCEVHNSTGECADGGLLPFQPFSLIFFMIEWTSSVIFTVETTVRFLLSESKLLFFFRVGNLIDVAAWLPFWITGALHPEAFQPPIEGTTAGGSTGFLRALRLLRVLRVFKMGRYSLGMRIFSEAIILSMPTLTVLVICGTIATTIFASLIYIVEQPSSNLVTPELLAATGREEMHALCFRTIPSGVWWSITTMTTVGYGDCFPITVPGKIIATFCFITGIIVLALPISVLGSNFAAVTEMFEEEAAEVARTTAEQDGKIDESELRDFLRRHRKEGTLRRDRDVRVGTLLSEFGDGRRMSMDEFKAMSVAVVDKDEFGPLNGRDAQEYFRKLELAIEQQTKHLDNVEDRVKGQMRALERKLDELTGVILAANAAVHAPPGEVRLGDRHEGGLEGGLKPKREEEAPKLHSAAQSRLPKRREQSKHVDNRPTAANQASDVGPPLAPAPSTFAAAAHPPPPPPSTVNKTAGKDTERLTFKV
jgi:hypothetical protein